MSTDWTVVLERECAECGANVHELPLEALAVALRTSIDDWVALLQDHDSRSNLSVSPAPGVWSAVEYAFHIADMFDVFQERVFLMLTEDSPQFSDWVPDESAESTPARTPEMAAAVVSGAGERFAAVFESLRHDLCQRPGWGANGFNFTVLSIGRYVLHDVLHHLVDATRGLASVSAKGSQ